ncbi:hypothetical protein ACTFIZ_008627 [Dictyostelium cf. discoideum]
MVIDHTTSNMHIITQHLKRLHNEILLIPDYNPIIANEITNIIAAVQNVSSRNLLDKSNINNQSANNTDGKIGFRKLKQVKLVAPKLEDNFPELKRLAKGYFDNDDYFKLCEYLDAKCNCPILFISMIISKLNCPATKLNFIVYTATIKSLKINLTLLADIYML